MFAIFRDRWPVMAAVPIVTAVAAAMLCASCGSAGPDADGLIGDTHDDAQIVRLGGGTGESMRDVPVGGTVNVSSLGRFAICLDRPGRVTVDAMEPELTAGDLEVEAIAIAPWGEGELDEGPPPGPGGPAVLDRVCTRTKDPFTDADLSATASLRLRLRRVSEETAVAERFSLHYSSGGQRYELSVPWRIVFCEEYDYETPHCERSM